MIVEMLFEEIRALSLEDRKRLLDMIEASLTTTESPQKTHNLLEFAGVAAHLADDEDPQDYINRLCDEWDREV